MKLDIPSNSFKVSYKEDLALITPSYDKRSYSDWKPGEHIYRSVVINKNTHDIVSQSFPKFFNWGEGNNDHPSNLSTADYSLLNCLREKDPIYFTEKMDGSTIIVSPQSNGELIIRTRGTLEKNVHTDLAEKILKDKYWYFLDRISELEGMSYIFELISPDLQIIIPYEEDDLILIGAVDHPHDLDRMTYFDIPELEEIADDFKLNLVPIHELPQNVSELMQAIQEWDDKEGIVARFDLSRTMVKIKSGKYLAMHRMKFALSDKFVYKLCFDNEIMTEAEFREYIYQLIENADYELSESLLAFYKSYSTCHDVAFKIVEFITAGVHIRDEWDRKRFALDYASKMRYPTAAFLIRDKKNREAFRYILKSLLSI